MSKSLLLLICFLLTAPAFASLTTCSSGTFALYLVPNFSCQSGNLIFTNFTYLGMGNPSQVTIPATGINVQPITQTGHEGFQFASGWDVGTQAGGMSSFQNSLIGFVVTDVFEITDLVLGFNGSFTGTGTSSTVEAFCLNATTVMNCPTAKAGSLNVTNPPPFFDNQLVLGAVTSIAISDTVDVASGVNGTAAASQMINEFSGIPEPLPAIMLGSGLIGIGLVRRRMWRR